MGEEGHNHGAGVSRKRLTIALSITASVLVAEVIGAIITGSLALLVDAAHMLTDTAGLTIALIAAHLATRPTNNKRTWGWARAEVVGAAMQATVLLLVGLLVLVEGIRRFSEPPEVPSTELIIFGVIGLAGNVISLGVLMSGRTANLNMRAAFLEVMNDALGSVAVIVAAVSIALFGWMEADIYASIAIALLIVPRTLVLLRESLSILLETTPKGLELDSVRTHLEEVPHVVSVHELHASLIATGMPQLSAHVVVEDACFRDGHAAQMLDDLQECVAEHFHIEHATFQLESAEHAEHERPAHR